MCNDISRCTNTMEMPKLLPDALLSFAGCHFAICQVGLFFCFLSHQHTSSKTQVFITYNKSGLVKKFLTPQTTKSSMFENPVKTARGKFKST